MKRLAEIDIVRGIAIILMVLHHNITWLYTGSVRDLYAIFNRISFGDIAAPLFFLVAGISLFFSSHKLTVENRLNYINKVFKKNLNLYLIGTVLCIIVFGPGSSYYWGVLQGVAVANLLLFLCLSIDPRSPWILIPVGLAVHFGLQNWATGLPRYLELILMQNFSVPIMIFYQSLGYIIGKTIKEKGNGSRNPLLLYPGGALLIMSVPIHYLSTPISRYPLTFSYFAFCTGILITLLALFSNNKLQRLIPVRVMQNLGQAALFAFVFHYAYYYLAQKIGCAGRFSPTPALLIALALLLICICATGGWRKITVCACRRAAAKHNRSACCLISKNDAAVNKSA